MNLYDKVPIELCIQRKRKGPMGGHWLEINKGDKDNIKYRSRYVAKDFKQGKGGVELFAATPPLEALEAVLAAGAMGVGRGAKSMINDISRALFMRPRLEKCMSSFPRKMSWRARSIYVPG